MEINKNIFRAYDIRGIAYEELSKEIVTKIGVSIAQLTKEKGSDKVILGRDGRNSSPDMFDFLAEGILLAGCDIIDIGIVPTPALYFASHNLESDCGVMITGSHNPSNHNGFKIVMNNIALSGKEIQNLRERTINIRDDEYKVVRGSKKEVKILDEYRTAIVEDINLNRDLKVVIDCGNGAASIIAERVYQDLNCEVIPLFSELDGNFPNHHPDPSKEENMLDLVSAVKKNEADIGLAFDGDADRLGVVSKDGEIISADRQMMIFSEDILKNIKKGKVVYDVKCSNLLPEIIKKNDGVPVISKTGHSFIKKKIREVGACLGGEMSGHIFFNDRWPGFDDGIYAGARMLEIVSNLNENEDVFKGLPKLVSTPEINIESTDDEKFKIVEDFISKANYKDSKSVFIDGVRIEFDFGWGLLRASNTSPILVLRFEADTQENLESIKNTFRRTLNDIKPNLGSF